MKNQLEIGVKMTAESAKQDLSTTKKKKSFC